MKAKVTVAGDRTQVVLEGHINEGAEQDLIDLSSKLSSPNIDIDCAGLKSLNSIGISAWMQFLDRIPSDRNLFFDRCPQVLIDAQVMIERLFGHGKVRSFTLTEECDECSKYVRQDLTSADVPEAGELDPAKCPECGSEVTFEIELANLVPYLYRP